MVVSEEVEILFQKSFGWQSGMGFVALEQVLRRTATPILRQYVVQAAKRVGIDSLESAAPEVSEVVGGWRRSKAVAKGVGRQTLRWQIGSGSRKREAANFISCYRLSFLGERSDAFSHKDTSKSFRFLCCPCYPSAFLLFKYSFLCFFRHLLLGFIQVLNEHYNGFTICHILDFRPPRNFLSFSED